MDLVVIPVLIALLAAPAKPHDKGVEDFSRFSRHVGQQISMVDLNGVVREGTLTAASADSVTMQFGAGQQSFSRVAVTSAARLRDGSIDGAIKGAGFGAFIGMVIASELDSGERLGFWLESVAAYTAIGFLMDASQAHRETFFNSGIGAHSGGAPKPALKLSLRF